MSTLQRPPSDRAVDALTALGGTAPQRDVEARLSRRAGVDAARLAIGLAIATGRIERVAMVDGSPGLALAGGRR